MTDREKIIMGLEHCIADNCDLCPYDENVDCPGFDPTPKTLLADALALLKAQEPVYPTWEKWLIEMGVLDADIGYAGDADGDWQKITQKLYDPIPADIAEKLGIEPEEGTC